MAEFFKILKADPLGAPWTPKVPNAKPVQTWWCQVEGQDKAVSVGKQVGNTLRPGQHIYGDLKYAKSQKGTEYWRFDSVQVPDDVQRPTDDPATPAQATAQAATGADMSATMPEWFMPIANQIDYIFREMRKMDTSRDDPEPAPEPPKAEPDKPEQVAGEPIDEETQKTLDDIFTPPETPDDVKENMPKEKK